MITPATAAKTAMAASLLAIAGTLTNNDQISIGNTHLTAPDEITANGLDNTSTITLTGASTTDTATLAITGLALDTSDLNIEPSPR